MPQNVQTTRQLHSFHMLARQCSIFKLGCNSVWSKRFQMHRLDLEKAEEPCHFADKGLDSQDYGFSSSHVQMWKLDHKMAELQRTDALQLWCWRTLLRVPWTLRRSNQSILKEINSEYSLEELTLKLKLCYFGHLMGRANSLEKTLMLGKTEGKRRRGNRGWDSLMASLTQ